MKVRVFFGGHFLVVQNADDSYTILLPRGGRHAHVPRLQWLAHASRQTIDPFRCRFTFAWLQGDQQHEFEAPVDAKRPGPNQGGPENAEEARWVLWLPSLRDFHPGATIDERYLGLLGHPDRVDFEINAQFLLKGGRLGTARLVHEALAGDPVLEHQFQAVDYLDAPRGKCLKRKVAVAEEIVWEFEHDDLDHFRIMGVGLKDLDGRDLFEGTTVVDLSPVEAAGGSATAAASIDIVVTNLPFPPTPRRYGPRSRTQGVHFPHLFDLMTSAPGRHPVPYPRFTKDGSPKIVEFEGDQTLFPVNRNRLMYPEDPPLCTGGVYP